MNITVVLAMSVDGKIADGQRSPARFGSPHDKRHLETQIAQADAVMFGAGTLRAYGTTLRVSDPALLHQRHQQGKLPQPIQIVCSASGKLDPALPFFRQPVPRWLLTTAAGARRWATGQSFEQILIAENTAGAIAWPLALQQLGDRGIQQLTVTGGGELVATLLAANQINDLWITLCPLILGGSTAPTLVAGDGFTEKFAPRLELIQTQILDSEVFLHYRVKRMK